jgi:hypothetical protein
MKPYLVDVPVKMNIWIRPDCQRKQWNVIKQARPSILFVQSDGGRNEKEWEAIHKNRKMFDEELDWDCTVYRFYEDHNNGLYAIAAKVASSIWSKVDRCVFLEDDQIPAVSYFQFCADLLEKYKDDERIECICGVNCMETTPEVSSDYFFSRQGSIWGFASWKRVLQERTNFIYYKDPYIMKLLKERTRHNKRVWTQLNAFASYGIHDGHVPGSEFWIAFEMYSQNRLQIIPRINLISNVGCTDDSEHASSLKMLPKGIRSAFNMPVHEMEFPLKHPTYVIPDVEYEKKRNLIYAYNHPIINFKRRIERLFLYVRYCGLKKTYKEIKRKLHRTEK